MAFRKDVTVAIFSLEMSKEQLVNRLLAMESHVDSQNLRTGNLKDEDWTKLVEGADIIGRSNLIIDDTPGISIAEMRSKCRKYKLEHNLGDHDRLSSADERKWKIGFQTAGNFRYFTFAESTCKRAECTGNCIVSA